MIVFGIVGLKNSGKTFIIQKLIKHFVKNKFKVASIKHAHHNFDIDKPNTDSFLHRKAGSLEVVISSSNRLAKIIELNNSKEKKLDELIKDLNPTDIVVVEGYKKELHSKIEIIKDFSNPSNYLFPSLKNVVGLISEKKINTDIRQFKKHDIELIANYILKIKPYE